MKIELKNFRQNPAAFMRNCGYAFENREGNEMSFARRITGRDYPRFHVYARTEGSTLIINLHLDQKKPTYNGSRAHSGEYEGELIEAEANRITNLKAD